MSFGDGIILFMDENNNDDSLKKYNELVFCFVDFYANLFFSIQNFIGLD